MYEFFTASGNLLFSSAFTLLILIAVLEVLSSLFGAAISGILENVFPEFDIDFEVGPEMPETTGMTKFFVWMEIGRVPMIITFCFFLMVFSLAGFGVQSVASTLLLGNQLPWFLASPAVFVAVLPVVKFGNRALARVWPRDETTAVSREAFIGRTATILLGTATYHKAAEAKLVGPKGRTHYVMVLADNEDETFGAGANVLIVNKRGPAFSVIKSTIPKTKENRL